MRDDEPVNRGHAMIVRWARRRYEGMGARVRIARDPAGNVVVWATVGGRKETTIFSPDGMDTSGSLGGRHPLAEVYHAAGVVLSDPELNIGQEA